jgi:hypothetical protein
MRFVKKREEVVKFLVTKSLFELLYPKKRR